MTSTKTLYVYLTQTIPQLEQVLVGALSKHTQGSLTFCYDTTYLASPSAKPLSQSLPLQAAPFDHVLTEAYFSGLLPDEWVRKRVARYLNISVQNTFGLLEALGGECAGAVALSSEPFGVSVPSTYKATYQPLTDEEAAALFATLEKRPLLAGEEGVRMSGAGAQDKLMVLLLPDHRLAIPKYQTPSSHLLKPNIRDLQDTVHNEYFCMRLAHQVGLPTPPVMIRWVQGVPYYLVERYDRQVLAMPSSELPHLQRLHQEDFCQALRIAPQYKYENEGGPTLTQCFALLEHLIAQGWMLGREKLHFFQKVLFNFMIGNGDAHGKNFSLLYHEGIQLAPTYDVLCTLVYGNAYKAKMAMKLGDEYHFKRITMRHILRFGASIGLKPKYIEKQTSVLLQRVLTEAPKLVETLQASEHTASPLYTDILTIIYQQAQQLQ